MSRNLGSFSTAPVDTNPALLYLLIVFAWQTLTQNLIPTVQHVLAEMCVGRTMKVPLSEFTVIPQFLSLTSVVDWMGISAEFSVTYRE